MGLISECKVSKNNKIKNIKPAYLDTTNPKFILVDNTYISSFLVVGYQKEMEGGFLDKMLFLGVDLQISIYYEKQNTNEIIKKLTYQIGNTGADIKNSNENQIDINVIGKTYNDAKYIRKQMQIENEELYYIYIYISVYSNSIKKLELNMKKIENISSSIGLTVVRATYMQEDVLMSNLPLMKNNEILKKLTKRNILTEGLSSTYPFLSSEICDENGIFLGTNQINNSLVMVDRFNSEKYKNANMFVIRNKWFRKIIFYKTNGSQKQIFKYFTIHSRSR